MQRLDEDFVAKVTAVLTARVEGFAALTSCERLTGGANQETYRLVIEGTNGATRLALRRAAGGVQSIDYDGYVGLDVEAKLMQCARRAGVPEPEIHYVLNPDDGLGPGFIMEWLAGETLGARVARMPELDTMQPTLAYQCGEILARIHAIDVAAEGLTAALDRVTPKAYVEQVWDRYQAFETPQPMIDYTARWLLDNLPPEIPPGLVHNDFRNGNLIVSGDGVAAVLDWEIAYLGDPMRDLGWICTNSWRFGHGDKPVGGFGERRELFDGYESVAGAKVDAEHVRFWEIFGSYWWAVGCLGMAAKYRDGPDRTVERPAIATRTSECQIDCVNHLIPGPVELCESGDDTSGAMPRTDELVASVRDFLHEEVMAATDGRLNFMARVAGNALDIVARELALGDVQRRAEGQRLRAFFGTDAPLDTLRWRLVDGLRDGTIGMDAPGLAEHLRATVVNRVAIDQPRYSGFKTAIEFDGSGAR